MFYKVILFSIAFCLSFPAFNQSNSIYSHRGLIAGIPVLSDLSAEALNTSIDKHAFQFYWKAKNGKYYLVNDKASSKIKINQFLLYYSFKQNPIQDADFVLLPQYFRTKHPVQISRLSEAEWKVYFLAENKNVYEAVLKEYNTAKWMENFLGPDTSSLSLKDIVFPGSHDAGMSVLTATGGQQKGTINACNTLTQLIGIEQQLQQGIRMFDLRVGAYNKMLYTKHAASDCMEDAIGGGYGERLKTVAVGLKKFLEENKQEVVLISFSHFCEKEVPLSQLQDSLLNWIGQEHIYNNSAATIADVPLKQLAGKVILSFEIPGWNSALFPRCDMTDTSNAFINFRRAYASTNNLDKLLQTELDFFNKLKSGVSKNDLIRLDWQITQSADEASAICNDFQDEKLNPIVNGAILLANMIRKNKSIIDHAKIANLQLPVKINEWISNKVINKQNKPNVIYVDVAGTWATDYCVTLLQNPLYRSN
ncbi:MAG: hypothetical protein RI983_1386 [Bacteroidota bacterium]|jgi:hypothetical protein